MNGKTCGEFLYYGSYGSFMSAVDSCNLNNDCKYILDKKCSGKDRFSLCRTVENSKDRSCVYQKGIAYF